MEETQDIFRKEYTPVTEETKAFIIKVKEKSQELYDLFSEGMNPNTMRETALAKTKLEEAVMWAVKGLTK